MKVLMLVISSDTFPVYAEHRKVWRHYMKSHPQIDCYFLQSSPTVFVPTLTQDTLWVRGSERYGSILRKTLDGLSDMMRRRSYTHVVRTNLSCVWDFRELIAYLQTLPSTGVYAGMRCDGDYVSGAGIIMTRDIVELLLRNRALAESVGIIDDVDIGHVMRARGVPLIQAHRVDFVSLDHYTEHHDKIPPHTFQYRVKHKDYLGDRMEEPVVMLRILQEKIFH